MGPVGTQGDHRGGLMLPKMQVGEDRAQGKMDSQVCHGKSEWEGGCREGQDSNEGGSAKDAPQGADYAEEEDTKVTGTKRLREPKRRTGHRRNRANVIESDDDGENIELLKRGATMIDCKRQCGDSSVS